MFRNAFSPDSAGPRRALRGLGVALSFAFAAGATTFGVDAHAQQRMAASGAPQWYLGAGIGRGNVDGGLGDNYVAAAGTASTVKNDNSDTAFRGFGGLKLNPYLAIEGHYTRLGRFGARRSVTAPVAGSIDSHFTGDALGGQMLAIWPVAETFALFGKLGGAYVHSRNRISDGLAGTETKQTSNKFAISYGIGAQLDITRNLGLRADWDIYKRATNSSVLSANGSSMDFKVVTGSVVVTF